MEITIIKTTTNKKLSTPVVTGFGKYFTDHMFTMDYIKTVAWTNPQIITFDYLAISPSTSVFHYAQSVFEGMKAYLNDKGEVVLFRPYENAKRFKKSCLRMAMPYIEEDDFVQAISELVKLDKDWIPSEEGTSLYIRPFMFATDEVLGVHPSNTYKFIIILSPVGHYYPNGLKPISISINPIYSRSFFGGTGDVKCAANYSISLLAQKEAKEKGFDQVLWLGGKEHNIIAEVGAMNIMFVINNEVITPKLDGTILAGVTRDSSITLLKEWGYIVSERDMTVDELLEHINNNEVSEAFGTGTAATISPVGLIEYKGTNYHISDDIGPVAKRLYETFNDIKTKSDAPHREWVQIVK
ncbi:branched-chain amino acid aminotransferase [Acholeplasma manati]|uniref:branched-chain-amino-acid transaminase n=1 Tax=Paracholeplasma manati TaxID=591373 RepID=A0ABT2Y437_9MOLU|nr:branched-chain amino acid aminotransferase [Paracholeplasma manati]MCV2231500.1 branched-chain amino acid aminotransferase [Paracholeplasma manati]